MKSATLLGISLLTPVVSSALSVGHAGFLLDAQDAPLTRTAGLSFRLYAQPAGGTSIWDSGTCQVDVRGGRYATTLGESCGGALDATAWPASEVRYLEVQVEGTILSPRVRMGSVPVAQTAARALDADKLGGADRAAFWERTSDLTTAKVGAGTLGALLTELQSRPTTVSVSGPLAGNGTAASPITLSTASATAAGALSSADWSRFDSKLGSVSVSGPLAGNGSAASPITLSFASATAAGALSSADWSRFDSKLTSIAHDASLEGDGTSGSPLKVSATASATASKLQVLASRPTSPDMGSLFFNSSTRTVEVYDGTRWQTISANGELNGLTVYYDAGQSSSYPGAGSTWYDVSGNGINASMTGGLSYGTLGGIASMVFNGTGAHAEFPNARLDPQRMTAIYWVYSQLPTTGGNLGGLYVNRTSNTPNASDWVWFGRYGTDLWYYRVNLGGTCCNDLTGSGTTAWSDRVPANQWKMVHFAFETGTTGGWKWGVDGASAFSGTLASRPNTQTEGVSSIGVGHDGSGSYWQGGIASTRFYNRLLSETELASEFNRLKSRYGR